MIKTFWKKLDANQRKLVAGAAILVLIALILEIAVFPFWAAKTKLTKAIQINQKKLTELSQLDAEFTLQEASMSRIKAPWPLAAPTLVYLLIWKKRQHRRRSGEGSSK